MWRPALAPSSGQGEKAGRKPLKDIKTLFRDDAAAVEKMGEEIRAYYSVVQGLIDCARRRPRSHQCVALSSTRAAILPQGIICASRVGRCRRNRGFRARDFASRSSTSNRGDHAGVDRGRAKGQARVVSLHGNGLGFCGALSKFNVREKFPGIPRASSARCRARVQRIAPGVQKQHPAVDGEHRGPGALHFVEAQRLARGIPARRSAAFSDKKSTTLEGLKW